jgi:hypothetical protein
VLLASQPACYSAGHMASTKPSAPDLLELDIDLRLGTEVWLEVELGEWTLARVGALLRFAYGRGYCDALTEAEPGKLCRDHGFVVPRRSKG